jgi:hypothetical protein
VPLHFVLEDILLVKVTVKVIIVLAEADHATAIDHQGLEVADLENKKVALKTL